MEITNINSNTTNAFSRQANPGQSELDRDAFLRLLVVQLQNQDPVNPMESAEFASQLAQFNSVEQLINLNEGIAALGQQQELIGVGIINTQAASLSGKQVKVFSNQLAVENGKAEPIRFSLDGNATEVTVEILDARGNVVRSEKLSNLDDGDQSWSWNGKSGTGAKAPDGVYSVRVKATNGENIVGSQVFVEGLVHRVRFTNGGVQLQVNGLLLNLGDVEEIGESSAGS